MTRLQAPVTLLLLALAAAACQTSGPGRAGSPAGGLPVEQLRRQLGEVMKSEGVPGAVIGVFGPDGSWVYAAGDADIEGSDPMRRDDIFPIRSITKSMTVTMIQQLAEESRLSLDDPIANYVKGVPNGRDVTLRQLGDMTSGLADYSKSEEFGKDLSKDPDAVWTIDELLAYSFDQPPVFEPGARFEYSNTNTLLLGLVVEKVTGKGFGDALAERVLRPAGMSQTSYPADGEVPDPHPTGYQLDDEGTAQPVSVNLTGLGPAGGVTSTVDDLRRYAEALFDGTLISKASLRQRMRNANPPGPQDPEYDAYGLGLGELNGWWGHTGEGLGFEALVMHDERSSRTVVILMNLTGPPEHVPTELFREHAEALGS